MLPEPIDLIGAVLSSQFLAIGATVKLVEFGLPTEIMLPVAILVTTGNASAFLMMCSE